MRGLVIFLHAFILFPIFSVAQENYYTKENILKFADYLYQNGESERAIGEYCRVMALCQDAKLKDTLAYRIAVAKVKLLQPVSARKYCAVIPADSTDSLLGEKAACLCAYSYYLEKKFDSSAVFASRAMLRSSEGEWRLRCGQIRVGALLQQFRWNDASVEAKKTLQQSPGKTDDTLLQRLYTIGLAGTKLHLKSAGLAGALSAVVPGSGKVYAGRPWDGLSSLFMIGILAWQAYEGYEKDGLVSGRCMAFGLLGSAFYTGNVYGSVNAARLYNQSCKRALCDRINLRFDW